MDDSLNLGALLITVEEEATTLGELAGLLRDERAHLIQNENAALLENLSNQEKTLRRIGKLEEQRLKLVESMDGTPCSPSLTQIPSVLRGEPADRLRGLASELKQQAADIQRLTSRNRRLIESGLGCVQGFLGLALDPEPTGYGQGRERSAEPRLVERWA